MRIGIDVGGTKIEGLTLSTDGRELARHRVATPTVYDGVLAAIVELVARLEAGHGTGRPRSASARPGCCTRAGA